MNHTKELRWSLKVASHRTIGRRKMSIAHGFPEPALRRSVSRFRNAFGGTQNDLMCSPTHAFFNEAFIGFFG